MFQTVVPLTYFGRYPITESNPRSTVVRDRWVRGLSLMLAKLNGIPETPAGGLTNVIGVKAVSNCYALFWVVLF